MTPRKTRDFDLYNVLTMIEEDLHFYVYLFYDLKLLTGNVILDTIVPCYLLPCFFYLLFFLSFFFFFFFFFIFLKFSFSFLTLVCSFVSFSFLFAQLLVKTPPHFT